MDINKVTTAMINYYQGQPKRIQHFLKVHAYAKLIGEQVHSRCWKTYNMTKQKQTESAI